MPLRALTWNLFHGRDFAPDPALHTWRSRILRVSERNATHVQVNRDLLDEFAGVIAGSEWDVALLQEVPPRWRETLAARCDADSHIVLTARNSLAPLRSLFARLNPDLIASNEGGSNLILVRREAGEIRERRELKLRVGPRPERRAMAFARVALATGDELCVANLHLSAGRARREAAEEELRLAARRATEWAGGTPLIFGGDLNLRPAETALYEELERHFDLSGKTGPKALDHLLARGLAFEEPAAQWAPELREVREGELAIRLSDHAPVSASFRRAGIAR